MWPMRRHVRTRGFNRPVISGILGAMRRNAKVLAALVTSFATWACSSDHAVDSEGSAASGTGGNSASGGASIGGSAATVSGGATTSGSTGGSSASGGFVTGGGSPNTGGSTGVGGSPNTGGSTGSGGSAGAGGASTARCDDSGLVWKTANKTHYTSYPDPGSAECIQYNGCTWAGLFAACNDKKPESWVASHDIVALFPLGAYADHDLCLRSGASKIVVTAIDTCGDSDCNGCCTQNKGSADALVDVESYTDARWGVPDGPIEWADLGLNPNACN
jgi:hypothetical protein